MEDRLSLRAILKSGMRVGLDLSAHILSHIPRRDAVRVLTYHEVFPGDAPCANPYNQVSARRLAAQIDTLLEAGYTFATISRMAAMLGDPGADLARTVCLTFDDGLQEHATLVLPILRERGVAATFYVLTGRVGRFRGGGRGPGRHLSPAELGDMAAAGMEIGSHGKDHAVLVRLSGSGLDEEVGGSRDDLTRLLGAPPSSFSYPYGTPDSYGAAAVAAVRRAGYANAVSTIVGANRPGTSIWELRRIPSYDSDTPNLTLARARGAYDWTGRLQGAWLALFPHHASMKKPA